MIVQNAPNASAVMPSGHPVLDERTYHATIGSRLEFDEKLSWQVGGTTDARQVGWECTQC